MGIGPKSHPEVRAVLVDICQEREIHCSLVEYHWKHQPPSRAWHMLDRTKTDSIAFVCLFMWVNVCFLLVFFGLLNFFDSLF